jgi:alkanesulfonate monooxygenase SsuD/methylene tetrahydromethanopterin reductase-like flavin-dependent oxidoreductase (luciferase family)
MRPFRFLATVDEYCGHAELTSLARRAEAAGCSAFVMPDHLIGQYGAMPLLAMVAEATLIDDLDALAPVVQELAGK